MFTFSTDIRIHYALTDKMGVVYHSRFIELFEISRNEAIRNLGVTYKEIESMGLVMPVTELNIKFLRPAFYDDLLTVKTILKKLPEDHKIIFFHETYNEAQQLLNTGSITLYFMNAKTMTRAVIPEALKLKLSEHFTGND